MALDTPDTKYSGESLKRPPQKLSTSFTFAASSDITEEQALTTPVMPFGL